MFAAGIQRRRSNYSECVFFRCFFWETFTKSLLACFFSVCDFLSYINLSRSHIFVLFSCFILKGVLQKKVGKSGKALNHAGRLAYFKCSFFLLLLSVVIQWWIYLIRFLEGNLA